MKQSSDNLYIHMRHNIPDCTYVIQKCRTFTFHFFVQYTMYKPQKLYKELGAYYTNQESSRKSYLIIHMNMNLSINKGENE